MNRRTDAQYLAFLESLPLSEVCSAPPMAGDGNDSEQAGAGIALACLDALLAAKEGTQGQRIRAVQSAVVQLIATDNPKAAAAGFACIVENVLSRGMVVHP